MQYVLGKTEALRSISMDNTASCWESGNTDIDELILKMVSLKFYLEKHKSTPMPELKNDLARLYEEYVPEEVREYLEARNGLY